MWRIRSLIAVSAAVLFLADAVFAGGQAQPKSISLTCEQKLGRVVQGTVAQWCSDISFAKSLGKNAADYAKFRAKLEAPSWSDLRGGRLFQFAELLLATIQIYEDHRIEFLEESETKIKIRTNRPYALYFEKNLTLLGVKLDEYEESRRIYCQQVANLLGFAYSEAIEGGWLIMTLTK